MVSQGEPDSPPPPYDEGLKEPYFDELPPKPDIGDDEGGTCGWLCFQPSIFKHFANPKVYLVLFGLVGLIQGALVNGFVNISITSIEKRYYLKSSESGLILSCYEIASLCSLVPVTYFGGRALASKPRWLGYGAILMGIGSFIFTLPHWISGKYEPLDNQVSTLCSGLNDSDVCSLGEKGTTASSASAFKWPFFLAHFLHGIGASPIFTLGITYLDEHLRTEDQPFYTGIFYVFVALGPAIGFLIGSETLGMYVDFPEPKPPTVSGSNFIGAWWLGFLGTGTAAIAIGWLVLGFPAKMRGAKAIAAEKVSQAYQKKTKSKSQENQEKQAVNSGTLKNLPKAAFSIISNPTFLATSLAGASEGFLVAGLSGFAQKILESQYMIPAGQAALLIGIVFIPAGCGGTFIGGSVVKKFKLKCRGMLNYCILLAVCGFASCFVFLLQCPTTTMHGLNYFDHSQESAIGSPQFNSTCNMDCTCSTSLYDPLCSSDNVLFYSPCFAGCSSPSKSGVFQACSCIASAPKNWTVSANLTVEGVAKRGKCVNYCDSLNVFLGIIFLLFFVTVMSIMPALSATLRCVTDDQRSFALGLQWLIIRLTGSIPGPIAYGTVIDQACLLSDASCDGKSNCLIYDNSKLSMNMVIISLITKGLSIFFFSLASLLYRPPPAKVELQNENNVEKAAYVNQGATFE